MGGSITMAYRFENGDAYCLDTWTNCVPTHLSDINILEDENITRGFIKECLEVKYHPMNIFTSREYGFILIDYMTKTILDVNHYTTLFGGIHAFEITKNIPNGFRNRYQQLMNSINKGHAIISNYYSEDGWLASTKYEGDDAINLVENEANYNGTSYNPFARQHSNFLTIDIDLSPWTYHCSMGDGSERQEGRNIAKQLGFPFSKKDGLNANIKSLMPA